MASTDENVLVFMQSFEREYGYPPTLQEIADAIETLNYRSSARYTIVKLVEAGAVYVIRDKRQRLRYSAYKEA